MKEARHHIWRIS